jgi:hypothetical protein
MEKMFYMQSILRGYDQDQLAVTGRELLGFSHCELLLLEAGSWGWCQFRNPEEGERPLLEATTKQQQWRCDWTLVCVITIRKV